MLSRSLMKAPGAAGSNFSAAWSGFTGSASGREGTMDGNISRREAVVAVGAAGSIAALLGAVGRAGADDGKGVLVADEKAVLFKVRDVTLDGVDETTRTVSASFGRGSALIKVTGLPLAEDIGIRVSMVYPGSVNNVPFDWTRLKGLVGKRVSLLLQAEESGLAVQSIAVAND